MKPIREQLAEQAGMPGRRPKRGYTSYLEPRGVEIVVGPTEPVPIVLRATTDDPTPYARMVAGTTNAGEIEGIPPGCLLIRGSRVSAHVEAWANVELDLIRADVPIFAGYPAVDFDAILPRDDDDGPGSWRDRPALL